MKYFEVHKQTLEGVSKDTLINSDGTDIASGNGEYKTITIGYIVEYFGERGEDLGEKFYPVYDDENKVLVQIKAEHQPPEWQNDAW